MNPQDAYPADDHFGPVIANHRHVDPDEAYAASDPKVADGSPDTAPWLTPDDWTVLERFISLLVRLFRR
jgi:hypothetical protein